MTATAPRPGFRWSRQGLIVAGGLIVAALVAFLVFGGKEKPPKDPYRTATVEQGSITKAVSASGTLEALLTPGAGLAPDARFNADGFRAVLAIRAEMEGMWGGSPPEANRYVDLSYFDRAIGMCA